MSFPGAVFPGEIPGGGGGGGGSLEIGDGTDVTSEVTFGDLRRPNDGQARMVYAEVGAVSQGTNQGIVSMSLNGYPVGRTNVDAQSDDGNAIEVAVSQSFSGLMPGDGFYVINNENDPTGGNYINTVIEYPVSVV